MKLSNLAAVCVVALASATRAHGTNVLRDHVQSAIEVGAWAEVQIRDSGVKTRPGPDDGHPSESEDVCEDKTIKAVFQEVKDMTGKDVVFGYEHDRGLLGLIEIDQFLNQKCNNLDGESAEHWKGLADHVRNKFVADYFEVHKTRILSEVQFQSDLKAWDNISNKGQEYTSCFHGMKPTSRTHLLLSYVCFGYSRFKEGRAVMARDDNERVVTDTGSFCDVGETCRQAYLTEVKDRLRPRKKVQDESTEVDRMNDRMPNASHNVRSAKPRYADVHKSLRS